MAHKKENLSKSKTAKVQPLTGEFASRIESLDFSGMMSYLPNMDPILQKKGLRISAYRDLLTDAHLMAVVMSRKSVTLSKKWIINRDKAPARVSKLVESVFNERLKVRQSSSVMLNASLFGLQPMEAVWAKTSDGFVIPSRFAGRAPEWFIYDSLNHLRFLKRDSGFEGVAIPERKIVNIHHEPSDVQPYGEALLARCFWPVQFKKGGLKSWVNFAEKYGTPFMLGKVPRNAGDSEFEKMNTLLQKLVSGSTAAIPDDSTIEPMTPGNTASSGGSAIYQDLFKLMNEEMSKVILGQTLTTEAGEKGARALGEVHQDIRLDLAESDENMLEDGWNQLIRWIVDVNFGTNVAAPKFEFEHEEDFKKDLAERDILLQKLGVKFNKERFAKTYGLNESEYELKEDAPESQPKEKTGALEDDEDREEFAEGKSVPFDQKAIDRLIEGVLNPARLEKANTHIEPIIKIFNESSSYDEAMTKLLSKYKDIHPEEMENLLGKSIFLSELWGRVHGDN